MCNTELKRQINVGTAHVQRSLTSIETQGELNNTRALQRVGLKKLKIKINSSKQVTVNFFNIHLYYNVRTFEPHALQKLTYKKTNLYQDFTRAETVRAFKIYTR